MVHEIKMFLVTKDLDPRRSDSQALFGNFVKSHFPKKAWSAALIELNQEFEQVSTKVSKAESASWRNGGEKSVPLSNFP